MSQQHTADAIVIGGGVAGASTAMQLSQRGLQVVVIERHMLGSGSTGRAAGLLGQLRSTRSATKMLVDGIEIVQDLQRRTGQEIFVQTGSLRVASTEPRAGEIRDHVLLGHEVGLPVEHLDLEACREMLPYMRVDDLLDACYCPTDGHLQPAELLAAYVQVARQQGVTFFPHTPVQRAVIRAGRIAGVETAAGRFEAPIVVNSTGPWSYLTAEACETRLPTAALSHVYLTTVANEAIPVDRHGPAVRDRENRIYSRPEAGGLIVGMYEADPLEYDMETLPEDFDMSTMRPPRDDYHVALLIDSARRRFPFITPQTPIHITQGIMTMTPDGQPFCGKSPDVDGLYHCAGFCGHGIVQSPVIGRIMAQLIVDGETPYDIGAIEADRFFETSELLDRAEVKQRCYRTYSNYYGQVMKPDVASS